MKKIELDKIEGTDRCNTCYWWDGKECRLNHLTLEMYLCHFMKDSVGLKAFTPCRTPYLQNIQYPVYYQQERDLGYTHQRRLD